MSAAIRPELLALAAQLGIDIQAIVERQVARHRAQGETGTARPSICDGIAEDLFRTVGDDERF